MAHHGNTAANKAPDCLRYDLAPFKFHRLRPPFLNKPGRIIQSVGHTDMIGHKRHVTYYQSLLTSSDYGFGMMNHILHRHRDG